MTRIIGVLRYELLMSWRRRSLPMVVVFFLLAVVGITQLVTEQTRMLPNGIVRITEQDGVVTIVSRESDGTLTSVTADAETAASVPPWMIGLDLEVASRTLIGIYSLIPAMMVIVVGTPILLSDTIPLDRQYKVRELLDTTPLTRVTYLAGKVASVWLGLVVGLVLSFVILEIVLYFTVGSFDPLPHLLLMVLYAIPLTLLASGVGILATSWAGSRRGALLMSLALVPGAVFVFFITVLSLADAGRLIAPIYGFGVMDMFATDANYRTTLIGNIAGTLLLFVLIFAAAWTFAWGFARIREAR